jgi:predicted ATP-grasp superfamily ATP-dependent carboligase
MEMHTRNSLWAYLATGSGLNITAVAYYDMIGKPSPVKNNLRHGVKWIDFNKDVKALLDYRKSGEWTFGRWLKSYSGKRVFHVHSLRDPLPFLMDSWFLAKRTKANGRKNGAAPHA